MTRLRIPLVLPAVALVGGATLLAVGVLGLVRRVGAITERAAAVDAGRLVAPGDPLTSRVGLVFTGGGVALAVVMVVLAVRWLLVRVDVSPDAIRIRGRDIPMAEVKGVVLNQSGGAPRLRVVRTGGEPVAVPAWALRAVHDDGETEAAGPALQRIGAEHGFRVKLVTMTGTKSG